MPQYSTLSASKKSMNCFLFILFFLYFFCCAYGNYEFKIGEETEELKDNNGLFLLIFFEFIFKTSSQKVTFRNNT